MRLDWKGRGLIFGMWPSANEYTRIRQASHEVEQWYSDLMQYHNALRAYSADDGRFPELADCVVRFWMRWHALEHGEPSCEHVQSWRSRERDLRIEMIRFLASRLGVDILFEMNRLVLKASLPLFGVLGEDIARADAAYKQFMYREQWWWPYELPPPKGCRIIQPPDWSMVPNIPTA